VKIFHGVSEDARLVLVDKGYKQTSAAEKAFECVLCRKEIVLLIL
jgi:hypothetical protein